MNMPRNVDASYSPIGKSNQNIAFIQANWHQDIVAQGRESFLQEVERQTGSTQQVDIFDVPGSYEIPLLAKRLSETQNYAVIVAAGFVVDGGIYRHEFVASAVIDAMMRLQLDTGVPIISMVLTPKNFNDHPEHIQFFSEHFKSKGRETAVACLGTLQNLNQISNRPAA
jgi:6,7-dimethyl-8-ribityllumazine synthase